MVGLVFIDPSGSKLSIVSAGRQIHKVCSTRGGEGEEGLKGIESGVSSVFFWRREGES